MPLLYVVIMVVFLGLHVFPASAQVGVRELERSADGGIDTGEWMKQKLSTERSPNMVGNGGEIVPADTLERLPVVTMGGHRWRCLGPFYTEDMAGSGRTSAIAINPRNPRTMIRATASGGLWKSVDDGASWRAVTDSLPTTGTTDVVYDPQDTNIVYVATGDAWRWTYMSHGIYRSTDGGETWNLWASLWTSPLAPWGGFYGIRKIVVSPSNADHVIAATNDGIFVTMNGGRTWDRSFAGMMFDALEMHPTRHNVVFAGNGDGNADNGILFRSTDGGLHWTTLTKGLEGRKGMRTYVCPSPADTTLTYAVIHDDWTPARIYTSHDDGDTWVHVHDTTIFFNEVAADPYDANTLYGSSFEHWISHDGGRTWDTLNSQRTVHCDHWQTTWSSDGTIYDCTDGGVWRRKRGSTTWENMNHTVCAFEYYDMHSAQTDTIHMMTGSQDNTGQYRSSADSLGWKHGIFHGDAMMCAVDHDDPRIVHSEGIGGSIFRTTDACVTWTGTRPPARRDGNWYTPFVMDRLDPNVLFMGMQELWKSTDKGTTWKKLADSIGTGENIDRIAIATSDRSVIVVSQGDHLHRSTDGGKTWRRLAAFDTLATNPHSFITDVKMRDRDVRDIWVTCDGYGKGGRVFRTRDGGATWTDMTSNAPVPLSYHAVALANDALHTVYIGSRADVFVRNDTMQTWARYDVGLPNVQIVDLELLETFGLLRACTWGRGVWETKVWDGSVVSVAQALDRSPSPTISYDAMHHAISISDPLHRAWRTVEVFDVVGTLIYSADVGSPAMLHPGLYIVRIVAGEEVRTAVIVTSYE